MGGVGVDISSEEEVGSGIGRVGLGVGQVVLVVLGVVGGHLAAQLQSGLHERVHGSHAACRFSLLLPAHLSSPNPPNHCTAHMLWLESGKDQTTL